MRTHNRLGPERHAACLSPAVVRLRFHPEGTPTGNRPHADALPPAGDAPKGGTCPDAPGAGARLNLLLSYAGWQADSWADRLPCLLEPLGVHAIRAASGRQASKVIEALPIHIAVVDLGLPLEDHAPLDENDEGGVRTLELLSRLTQPPPTVVVKRSRTHRDEAREMAAALRCGAFAVIDRPRDAFGFERMLEVLRRALVKFYQGRWPRATP